MAAPSDREPDDQDPFDRDLERRSGTPAVSPWLAVGLILMIGVVVYIVSALI